MMKSTLLAVLGLAKLGLGCVQAHNWLNNQLLFPDVMQMTVWVNGQIVCSDTDGTYLADNEDVFCLRNADGKGYGCAPGYTYCATKNGALAHLQYHLGGQVFWETELTSYNLKVNRYECFCRESGNGQPSCLMCSDIDNCVGNGVFCPDGQGKCELCDFKPTCGSTTIDPPKPFPFFPPHTVNHFRGMIVGDSLSHGEPGDWTWRYRLWQWLVKEGQHVDFLGPWQGTHGRVTDTRPLPPTLPGEAAPTRLLTQGVTHFAVDSDFKNSERHAAWSGRQASQVRGTIQSWVKDNQPDYLLIMLGFNDLGWWVSGWEGLLGDMEIIVAYARAANPRVKILIGNVVHRTFINGRQDLVENTNKYNYELYGKTKSWHRPESPIRYVDIATPYGCRPEGCPAGFDGLHPDALGEWQMAKAFSDVLRKEFGVGKNEMSIPGGVGVGNRPTLTPTGVSVQAVPEGIRVSWPEVQGARRYDVRMKLREQTSWYTQETVQNNVLYRTWVMKGQVWEAEVRVNNGNSFSAFSNRGSATANPATAPGPEYRVYPYATGIHFEWTAPSGYSVDRYEVMVYDLQDPNVFILLYGARGSTYTVPNLTVGHRYLTGISTWIRMPDGTLQGGQPKFARQAIPGRTSLEQPQNLAAKVLDATSVMLSWTGPAEAGYVVSITSIREGWTSYEEFPGPLTFHGIGFQYPGVWNYFYCVRAYNGQIESKWSNCVNPPKLPGYKRMAEEDFSLNMTAPANRTLGYEKFLDMWVKAPRMPQGEGIFYGNVSAVNVTGDFKL